MAKSMPADVKDAIALIAPLTQALNTLCGWVSEDPQYQRQAAKPDRLLLRPEEAAESIGVSRARIYELIANGDIPSIKIGKSRRVPVSALSDWIQSQIHQSSLEQP